MKYIEDCNGSLHVNQKTYLIISEAVLSTVISMIDAIICGANLAKAFSLLLPFWQNCSYECQILILT